jgi:hypothetical protein
VRLARHDSAQVVGAGDSQCRTDLFALRIITRNRAARQRGLGLEQYPPRRHPDAEAHTALLMFGL